MLRTGRDMLILTLAINPLNELGYFWICCICWVRDWLPNRLDQIIVCVFLV